MRKLLSISGKRFSGKDTLASLLQERARDRGSELGVYAFAAESKRLFVESQSASGAVVDLARLTSDRAYKEAWRPALTRFTVEAMAEDPLVFCRAVADRIDASRAAALVSDLRLRLEVVHLRARFDLTVVRLLRSDERRAASGWRSDPAADGHPTETELDEPSLWDEVVTNDGTIEALRRRAEALIRPYLG